MPQVQEDGNRQPVCFASRSLTNTELQYAVIEKEAFAATWACEKFAQYVTGMDFTVETDHKPLVSLLSSKDISQMPPRILRFRMRIMRFSPKIEYVQGKYQVTADALSRAPIGSPDADEVMFVEDVEDFTTIEIHSDFNTKTKKNLRSSRCRRRLCRSQAIMQKWMASIPT